MSVYMYRIRRHYIPRSTRLEKVSIVCYHLPTNRFIIADVRARELSLKRLLTVSRLLKKKLNDSP